MRKNRGFLLMNPYSIKEKTVISFSGGRTSAYMLKKALESAGPSFKEDAVVIFQNTGKENPETLDFIAEVENTWHQKIIWLEWQAPTHKNEKGRWEYPEGKKYKIVDHETANRDGGPFEALINHWGALPNVMQRFCTFYLKQEPMRDYLKKEMGWQEWVNFLGIRHDEPNRWKTAGKAPRCKREDRELPLVRARVTKKEINEFWENQNFSLRLGPNDSNCDLCFLKGPEKKKSILRENEKKGEWWIRQERKTGRTFEKGRKVEDLLQIAKRTPELPFYESPDYLPCLCTD